VPSRRARRPQRIVRRVHVAVAVRGRRVRRRNVTEVNEQLAAKQAVIDRYLTDYEDNKLDRDTVAARIDTLSAQIRALRHRRDELTFLLDDESDEPDGAYLTQLAEHVTEILDSDDIPQRKALCEALISELHLNGATVKPVFRVPITSEDAHALLGGTTRTIENTTVRERPPAVRRQGLEPRTRGLRVRCSAN
jgi:site-specific DNA recombinase